MAKKSVMNESPKVGESGGKSQAKAPADKPSKKEKTSKPGKKGK